MRDLADAQRHPAAARASWPARIDITTHHKTVWISNGLIPRKLMREHHIKNELASIVDGCISNSSNPNALFARLRSCIADLGELKLEALSRDDGSAGEHLGFWARVGLGRPSPNRFSGLFHPRAFEFHWTPPSKNPRLQEICGTRERDETYLAEVCRESQRHVEDRCVTAAQAIPFDRFVARMAFIEWLLLHSGNRGARVSKELGLTVWTGQLVGGGSIEFVADVPDCRPHDLVVAYVLPIARRLRLLVGGRCDGGRPCEPGPDVQDLGAPVIKAGEDAVGTCGPEMLESQPDQCVDTPISDTEKCALLYMLKERADTSDRRKTSREIGAGAVFRSAEGMRKSLVLLREKQLVASRPGHGGGYWLTSAGAERAALLRKDTV